VKETFVSIGKWDGRTGGILFLLSKTDKKQTAGKKRTACFVFIASGNEAQEQIKGDKKHMKRMLSMLMILALLLGSVSAFAQDNVLSGAEMEAAEAAESLEELEEEAQDVFDLYGEIVEITDEYVLINTADMGNVQVNLSEDTVIEGVDALEIGQTAVVMYNGMMTRSLPPQITALHIGVYAVSGVIAEVLEDSIVIVNDETGEQIILTLPGSELLGENEELLEDEALAAEEELDAELTEEIEEDFEEELEEESEEELEEELTEELLAEDEMMEEDAALEFSVGDKIIAYTTGAMTMSLPPQMNALAIVLDLGEEMLDENEEAVEASEEIEALDEEASEESDETVG